MPVSPEYLNKIRRAVRRCPDPDVDAELSDLIEECRRDLESVGVTPEKTDDENDPAILGAARCFVRWKFGSNNAEAAVNREDYMQLRDELRKRVGYCISAIRSA